MKVGVIAILGKPNAGKSTLLNALLSKKVSIVSPKAQTTRDSVMGVLNEKDRQIVFVDTPGIYYGDGKLDSHMRRAAFGSSRDVDAILYLIDGSVDSAESDIKILKSIDSEAPKIIVLNKIDLIRVEKARDMEAKIKEAFSDAPILETAFKDNFGLKEVKKAIEPYLWDGDPLFEAGTLTDKDREYQAKELIREKMLHFLRQEIPHQSAVRIDSFKREKGGYHIEASLIVEKAAHKSIVIGKGGEMIKKISMAARHEMERNWHDHVTALTIEVIVMPGWRNSPKLLAELGYGDR